MAPLRRRRRVSSQHFFQGLDRSGAKVVEYLRQVYWRQGKKNHSLFFGSSKPFFFFPSPVDRGRVGWVGKGKRHFVVFPPCFWLAFFFPSLLFLSFLYLALPFPYYQWLLFRLLVRALCISEILGEGGGKRVKSGLSFCVWMFIGFDRGKTATNDAQGGRMWREGKKNGADGGWNGSVKGAT